MTKVAFRKLVPEDQVRFLKAKGFKIEETWGWRDWKAPTHAGAWTVAKSAGFDILNDIYDAALKAKAEGMTPAMFEKQLTPILQEKGWWGRKDVVNPNTGLKESAQLGSPRRLRVIYDVNMRVAHAVGTWARIERLKDDRPWLCYSCILDRRTRPTHKAWHGTVLRYDDPFWRTHFPPNGWRCRCRVRQFSDDDLQRYGLKPSSDPAFAWHEVQNRRTGEVQMVPAGIDPGWAYNPGRTAFDVHAARALSGKLDDLAPGIAQAASEASAKLVAEPLARGFRTWVGEITAPGATAAGEAIPLGMIDREVLAALRSARPSLAPSNAVLSIGDKQIQHLARAAKANASSPRGLAKAMPVEDLKRLPDLLQKATGVYLDRGDLIYRVPSSVKGREGKIIVSLDYGADERVKGGRRVISRSARIKSAGLVDASNFGGLVQLR